MKRNITISFLLVIIIICIVLFLTFQGPKDTIALSSKFHEWFILLGYKGDLLQFRSDIHFIEYFIVGLVIVHFIQTIEKNPWLGTFFSCSIGIIDETIKIFLPTREFDYVDLVKDFLGVLLATVVMIILKRIYRYINRGSDSAKIY
jgi:hypothetical protein